MRLTKGDVKAFREGVIEAPRSARRAHSHSDYDVEPKSFGQTLASRLLGRLRIARAHPTTRVPQLVTKRDAVIGTYNAVRIYGSAGLAAPLARNAWGRKRRRANPYG